MKKFLAGLAAVAVLAAGGVVMIGLGSDVAMAQEDNNTTEPAPDHEAGNKGRCKLGRGLAKAAEVIGIDTQDLVDEVRAGSSIAEVAEANGSSAQEVIDSLVDTATQRIDTAVADGRLTAEEGSDKLAQLTDRITGLVNGDLQLGDHAGRSRHGLGLAIVAEVIGIDVDELREAIQAGSSIADVAEANGSSAQAVIDAMVSNVSDRIDSAVADGKLSADEGAERLAGVTDRVTSKVNGDLQFRDHAGRGSRGSHGPGQGAAVSIDA